VGSMPSWFAKTKEMAAFDRYFSTRDVDEKGLLDRYLAALDRLKEPVFYRQSDALQNEWRSMANRDFAIQGSLDAHFRGDWVHKLFDPNNRNRFWKIGGRFWPKVPSIKVVKELRKGTILAIYKAMGDTELINLEISDADRYEIWTAERENRIDIDDGIRGIALSWNCVAPAGSVFFDSEALRGPSVVELAIATPRPYGYATTTGISQEARTRILPDAGDDDDFWGDDDPDGDADDPMS
jgi:hypothetical protein